MSVHQQRVESSQGRGAISRSTRKTRAAGITPMAIALFITMYWGPQRQRATPSLAHCRAYKTGRVFSVDGRIWPKGTILADILTWIEWCLLDASGFFILFWRFSIECLWSRIIAGYRSNNYYIIHSPWRQIRCLSCLTLWSCWLANPVVGEYNNFINLATGVKHHTAPYQTTIRLAPHTPHPQEKAASQTTQAKPWSFRKKHFFFSFLVKKCEPRLA